MIRPTRIASPVIRSASRRTRSGFSSLAMVSATRLSAPTGVFSSWLMLATKSRRTASRWRRSEMSSMTAKVPIGRLPSSRGRVVMTSIRRGGPNTSRLRRRDTPSADSTSSSRTARSTSASA